MKKGGIKKGFCCNDIAQSLHKKDSCVRHTNLLQGTQVNFCLQDVESKAGRMA